jgi:hypothetical protein
VTTAPLTFAGEVRRPADRRTATGLAALVGGSLLLALGRLLTNDGGMTAQSLEQMAGHDARITASVLLAVTGFTALVPGFWVVAAQVQRRGAVLARIGAVLVVVGSVGFSVLASLDLVTLAATHVSAGAAMQDLLGELGRSVGLAVITPLAVAGYFFGPFLVTLAAWRARLVAGWLPWGVLASLVLQPVGVALGGPGLAHVVDAVCQLVLVVMTSLLAAAVLRRADALRD